MNDLIRHRRQFGIRQLVCGLLFCALALTSGPVPAWAALCSARSARAVFPGLPHWTNRARTLPAGQFESTFYDANGKLQSSVDALGNETDYTYDANGNPATETKTVTVTDASGGTSAQTLLTQYQYDAAGRMQQMTDARGHVTTYEYDGDGNQLFERTTRSVGGATVAEVTEHQYDDQDRLIATWDAAHPRGSNPMPTSRTVYDDSGKVFQTYDALGNMTQQLYDDRGLLTSVSYADGTSEQTTYDPDGRRQYTTDRRGRNTLYIYDGVGRLSETWFCSTGTTPVTRLSHNDYDASGRVYRGIDANGHATVSIYDAGGRRTGVIDAAGHLSQYGYDENGNQTSFTDPKQNTTSYFYDSLNRRVATVYAAAPIWTGTASQSVVTESDTAYDELGRRVGQYEQAPSSGGGTPLGQLTRYVYDQLGRLSDVVQPAVNHHGGGFGPAITHYDYDELGNQLTQIDAEGHTTSYTYDNLGRRLTRALPAGQMETMYYDANGNVSSAIDFNGHTTTYQYDGLNRLRFRIPDPSFGESAVEWRYTASGQRAAMIDSHGTTVYGYDDRDRLSSKTSPEGTITYGYDNASDVTSIASADAQGAAATYGYDNLNRLQTVTDANQKVTQYGYDPNGNLGSVALPNGLSAGYGYDALNRLSVLDQYRAGTPQPIVAYNYGLLANGQRRTVQEGNGRSCLYAYDNLWRLTGETITADPHGKNGIAAYTYDAVGNRETRSSTVAALPAQTFGYDADDRVQGDTYDANGNTKSGAVSQPASVLASEPSTTGAQPISGADSYDSQNRLIARNGSGSVQVVYDGDGNKVQESVTQNGLTTVTTYLIDSLNPTGYAQVLEEKTNGTLTRVYTWGHELISQDQFAGGSWQVSYYGYDGHGNVRFLSDATGNITDAYDFDAFGNLLNISTGTLAGGGAAPATLNLHLYCGEQFDAGLGMYYLRARLMNPLTGRFWTTDTYEAGRKAPQGLHKYLYSAASPLAFTDPSGHSFGIPAVFFPLVPKWVINIAAEIGPEVALYIFLGYLAHIEIGNAYREDPANFGHRIYINNWLSTIAPFGPAVDADFNSRLRPDIADATTREVYEIKSALNSTIQTAIDIALPQLLKYLDQLNGAISEAEEQDALPPGFGGPFVRGVRWDPPPEITLAGIVNVSVTRAAPGVILYGNHGELESLVALFGLVSRGPKTVAESNEAEEKVTISNSLVLALFGGVF